MLSSYEINCSSTQSDTAIKLIVWNYQIKKRYKRVKKIESNDVTNNSTQEKFNKRRELRPITKHSAKGKFFSQK